MNMTLGEIAQALNGKLVGDGRVVISGINSLDCASKGEISFFSDKRYRFMLSETKASALLVSVLTESFKGPQVVVPDPRLAHIRLIRIFTQNKPRLPVISDKANISPTSVIGKDPIIHPLVHIGKDAVLGDNITLFPGVFIGDRAQIGNNVTLFPNVTIMHDCVLGNEVIIHSGSVIGSDGFGFVKDGIKNVKVPHIGIVQIDDRAEIGANNCIDRATIGKTWIKSGVKTDNLVHIAHNCTIGEETMVLAQTGLSGSVEIGKNAVIGGQVGMVDHVKVGEMAMIGSGTGLYKSIPPGAVVTGNPAVPHKTWLKIRSIIKRLPELYERLKTLETRIKSLEKNKGNTVNDDNIN
ncbi:MAG: UDP-3-O-(3-hydroxymyristoyl)glucosamine N-acyltransferase [Deltaproteobacteria bacterium]|nr:UDP-3-O-(3-hydroxymyristoyl)glucosamine N-acyltransferase [Deltaproteobacteria bacterium]